MNLRHDDEPLNPEEARAFLQVHAEREARATANPEGPRIGDLAESLHIPHDEALAILREARGPVAVAPKANDRRPFVAVALAVGLLVVVLGATLTRQNAAPLQSAVAAPPAAQTGVLPADVPEGFDLSIQAGRTDAEASGPAPKFGTDYRTLSPSDAAVLRTRLVTATLGLMQSTEGSLHPGNVAEWMRAKELFVRLRVIGGEWTLVKVPLRPFTLPLNGNPGGRDELRRTLTALYEAGWAGVVQAAPR